MPAAPLPSTEFERLLALARYEILDSLPEERFDRITALTAEVLELPVALINFVDQFRQWGKSCVGLRSSEVPREHSFCAWTILEGGVTVVPDASADPRFQDNPLVTGAPHIRLYAGAPLTTPDGHRIGTLCVVGPQARDFGPREQRLLRQFAALAEDELEYRLLHRTLSRDLAARDAQARELRRAAAHGETLAAITGLFDLGLEPEEALRSGAELLSRAVELDWAGLLVGDAGSLRLLSSWDRRSGKEPVELADLSRYRGGVSGFSLQGGQTVFVDDYAAHPQARPEFVAMGVRAMALLPLGTYEGVRYGLALARTEQPGPWRSSDRALCEAAARSVRGALERARHLRQVEDAALHDGLTGLSNRRAFDRELARRGSDPGSLTALLIDLDGMKAVNDGEGHERGDTLLRLFGQALRAQFRPGDGVYRLGGDEFAVLLDGDLGPSADALLERVDLAVVAVRDANFEGVGASVGLAVGPAREAEALLREADARMYQHKRRKAARRGLPGALTEPSP